MQATGGSSDDEKTIASAQDPEIMQDMDEDEQVNDDDEGVNVSLNQPHPSLEYAPFFFALKRFPRSRERIRQLYTWRWRVSYPLQRRIPCSKVLQHCGIYLTYGEALVLLPVLILAIVCIMKSFVTPDVALTGKISRFGVFAALLFGQKNSYITMVLGVPFDRALMFHKISGYIAIIAGVLHGFAYLVDNPSKSASVHQKISTLFEGSMNRSGTMLLLFLLTMFVTSLRAVRAFLYELFYFIHLTSLIGIGGCAAFHTGPMVPLFVLFTTIVDLMIRKIYMSSYRYPKEASLSIISDSVVEVCFKKVRGFDYNPGQSVYIVVPEISMFEWHPFSMCSSPHDPYVTLYIRVAGNWTSALHKLAQKKSEVEIGLEGPYGNFGVDLANNKQYKTVMFVGGGIGLTPLQSLCSHLLLEHKRGNRLMKKVKFIWIERDPHLVLQTNILDTSEGNDGGSNGNDGGSNGNVERIEHGRCPASLASQILASIPPGTETDDQLEGLFRSFELVPDRDPIGGDSDDDEEANKAVFFGDFTVGNEEIMQSNTLANSSVWDESIMDKDLCKGEITGASLAEVHTADLKKGKKLELSGEDCSKACPGEPSTKFGGTASRLSGSNPESNASLSSTKESSTKATNQQENSCSEKNSAAESTSDSDILDVEIYLTSKELAKSLDRTMSLPVGVHVGRPDLASRFLAMRQEAIDLGETTVAVCVCGPQRITALCRRACIQLSDDTVRFDCHIESFG
ncbi:hypothetical protein ACA910_016191 [Epithemia clementina (nom. ined.)]